MSNVKIYVEYEEGFYEPLDLFDDETIEMNFKLKDSSDLAKVFSTYSQTFKIPDSENNRRLTNYFFNTEVERQSNKYLKAKIEVNFQIFKVGFISINEGTFKNNRGSSIGVNFFTSLSNLKELYGDEKLLDTLKNFTYSYAANTDKIVTPLASIFRVLTYGDGGINDVKKYTADTGKFLRYEELRPAIPFSVIMEKIAEAKDLKFNSELFSEDIYKKLYVWCNGGNIERSSNKWVITNTANNNANYVVLSPISFSGYSGLKLQLTNLVSSTSRFIFEFKVPVLKMGVPVTDNDVINYRVISDTNTVLFTGVLEKQGDYFVNLGDTFKVSKTTHPIVGTTGFDFRVEFDMDSTASLGTLGSGQGFMFSIRQQYFSQLSFANFNIVETPEARYANLVKLLPEMKTVDFLSSFIKMFNLNIIEDKINPSNVNFIKRNEFYLDENTKDYTPFINIDSVTIKPANLYKNISFKHKTAKYTSSETFKNVAGREYGELKYSSPDKQLKAEYKVETTFAIPVMRAMSPLLNMDTFYGFKSTSQDSASYGKLYTPNTEDFTVFYYNGNITLQEDGATTAKISTYDNLAGKSIFPKISVVDINNKLTYTNSLVFQEEVDVFDPSFIFTKNLYSNFYEEDIDRIYNLNTRTFDYDVVLPNSEVLDFSLLNKILIGDRKFIIEEANINITKGTGKLVVSNIAPKRISVVSPPTPPTTFTATLI